MEEKLKDALRRLIQLKEHKDKYGKDELYNIEQPLVWEYARSVFYECEGKKEQTCEGQSIIPEVSHCTSFEEILKDAVRRKATYQVQFADYDLNAWTAPCILTENRADRAFNFIIMSFILGEAQTYKTDLKLFHKLGLKTFKTDSQEEFFVGEYKLPHYEKANVKISVTCMPSQFWKFEVETDEDYKCVIKTGSGTLSDYWQSVLKVAKGCFVVNAL